MNVIPDLSGDLAAADATEAVLFTSAAPGGATTVTVHGALRRTLVREEVQLLAGRIALEPDDLVWHLPDSELAGLVPKDGDTIAAGTETWIVLSVSKRTLGTRWRAICRRAR